MAPIRIGAIHFISGKKTGGGMYIWLFSDAHAYEKLKVIESLG
jgi:hypothetical protein